MGDYALSFRGHKSILLYHGEGAVSSAFLLFSQNFLGIKSYLETYPDFGHSSFQSTTPMWKEESRTGVIPSGLS